MKKRILRFLKTYWIVIWLVLSVFVLASITTYAAYVRTQNVKRVISTMGGAGNRFLPIDLMNLKQIMLLMYFA